MIHRRTLKGKTSLREPESDSLREPIHLGNRQRLGWGGVGWGGVGWGGVGWGDEKPPTNFNISQFKHWLGLDGAGRAGSQ